MEFVVHVKTTNYKKKKKLIGNQNVVRDKSGEVIKLKYDNN